MDAEALTQIWRASARDGQLDKAEFKKFHVSEAAEAVIDAHLSLRAEGHVVYGISQICNSKAQLLLQDSERVDENTGASFREYIAQQHQMEPGSKRQRVNDSASLLDLDVRGLPASLLPQSLSDASARAPENAADLSIDDMLRADDAQNNVGDTTADGVVNPERTAEDEQDLAQELDFSAMLAQNSDQSGADAGSMDPGMDFGPDPEYSSSPPRTPPQDAFDEDIMVVEGEHDNVDRNKKLSATRRVRSAPIDEEINIRRPAKSRLLRKLPTVAPRSTAKSSQKAPQANLYIELDDDAERLLDPEHVSTKMHERRRADLERAEIGDISFGDMGDIDVGMDDDMGMDDFPLEASEVEEGDSEVDEEDTEEILKEDAEKARVAVKQALRTKGESVAFTSLAADRKARACTLMEVLQLAAKGRITIEQAHPWGDPMLTRVK